MKPYCETHGVNLVQSGGRCPLCERGVVEAFPSTLQVRRLKFSWINGEGDLTDDPQGSLVQYAHYEKLEQELIEAKRQRNDEQRLRLDAERKRKVIGECT